MNQTDNIPTLEPLTDSPQRQKMQKVMIAHNDLQKLQKRFAFATVLIPLLGSVTAIGSLWLSDIDAVTVGLLVSMYTLTMIGVELGFHRYFSHCAFQTGTIIRVVLAILGSMAAQGPVIYWVSCHRSHHQYSDQPGDPHSPNLELEKPLGRLRGIWHAHVGWLFGSYVANSTLYAKDLLRDPLIAKVNQLYLLWIALGLIIPTILGGILTWSWLGAFHGFLWGGLVRIFLVHHVVWSVNSLVHIYGDRPFDTDDSSRNNIWLALPTFGGAWHNNHHAFPNSAINALEWWQIDLCAWLTQLLEKMGLVWNVKRPTVEMINAKRVA